MFAILLSQLGDWCSIPGWDRSLIPGFASNNHLEDAGYKPKLGLMVEPNLIKFLKNTK